MGISKRWMDELREAKIRQEKETCACYYNWDDKFEVLCPKHRAEEREQTEREEAFHYGE